MNSKKLGFGLMRLPLLDPNDTTKIDYNAFCTMADRYMDAGFSYFDTATPYHGGKHSKIAFRECVAKRYPRESFTITNKLSFFIVQKEEELEEFFESQLERCGVEYFDYYLLHAMNQEYLNIAEEIHAFEFVARKKAEGKIRHIGFSFHDDYEVFEEILTSRPWDFCQIQYNYIDRDIQAGDKGYALAEKLGVPMVIMEPVKGGSLAALPEEVEAPLKALRPDASTSS